ncbi:hypothetical protein QUF61_17890 [Candidatus Venteria ishoeyi]|uniref:hypothetical protein n=1 Tax=Candidatus Venteria ishoeyi TaxID=1899563 RepID=UPI0025A4E913|nr:hypothetical protein [Candidatus Venteria ishoeyi]MDM8548366.1 hypothetical protein [Candidatus Venteria ishoeyi]
MLATVVEGVLCLLLSAIIHTLKIGEILQARAGIAAYMDTIDFDKGMLKPEEDDEQWEAWTNGDSCLIYCNLGAEINFENYFYPVPDI